MAKDYYAALGVSRTASEKEIRSAYRRLARKLHPDVNPNDKASETRFKDVNAAHEVLSDPEKRKKYDRYGDNWEHAEEIERAQRGRSRGGFRTAGPSVEFGEGGIGDLFGGMFEGRSGGRAARPRPQPPVEQPVEISLEEAFAGATRLLIIEGDDDGGRRLEVKIPAGVDTGARVRIAGEGRPGYDGRRGDLYLVVTVRPNDSFERKGDDLHVEAEVPLTTAVLGGEVEVATIDKKVALKLPPLTQNGRVFRLGGLGMPKLGQASSRGELYARVKVRLPEELDERGQALFEELKELGT